MADRAPKRWLGRRPLTAAQLWAWRHDGELPITDGVRWDAVTQVQVANVSGGRSLGALMAYVALLPLFALAHSDPSFAIGPTGTGTLGDTPLVAPIGVDRLFAENLRWRSYLRPVVTLDAGWDPHHPDALWNGATALLRLEDTFEIGGGVREIVGADAPMGDVKSRVAVSGRIGAHYDLACAAPFRDRDRHRWALRAA